MRFSSVLLFSFFLFIYFPGISQQPSKEQVVQQLDQLFDYLYKNDMFNGGVGVRYKGEIIFKKGYGKGNFETGTPFTPASQTEIASVSKHFTATAILMLWKDGKLRLDDDINQYISPELPYEGITIEHLLTHQSGVPEYTKVLREKWDHSKAATNADIVGLIRENKPAALFKPGTDYQYSNLGYLLLAEVVHKVSGKPLDQFLSEQIFTPFGMSSTGFYPRSDIYKMPMYAPGVIRDKKTKNFVRPETVKGREYVWYLSGRFGPGRLTSSVNDLLLWDSLLSTTVVLPGPIKKEMFTGRVLVNDKESKYGYGWRVTNADTTVVYHTGSWPGNLTYFKRYMTDRSAIVILNNTSSPYMAEIRNTADAIVEGKKWEYPKKK